MEYVEVRLTQMAIGADSEGGKPAAAKRYHSHSKGNSYITIFSPAVNEALRCVVDYYPSVDLSGDTVKVKEPFAMFVFFERELTEYRNRLLAAPPDDSCANKHAYEHIGIVQDFVRGRVQEDVDAERERHARGFATFDMLWLLYKPGADIYYDRREIGEHEPFVLKDVEFELANGTTNTYTVDCWHVSADGYVAGPREWRFEIPRFAGETEIFKLTGYPCEYLRFARGMNKEEANKVKEHFIARGKKWYPLVRGRKCCDFSGFTVALPRRKVSNTHPPRPHTHSKGTQYNSLVMVDPVNYMNALVKGKNGDLQDYKFYVEANATYACSPFKICQCDRCGKLIYQHAVQPKFSGYSRFDPSVVEELSEHQYFICDASVSVFVFKLRSWGESPWMQNELPVPK